MYQFSLVGNTGTVLWTAISPKEIASFYCFDAIDGDGQQVVVCKEYVDFHSFVYL